MMDIRRFCFRFYWFVQGIIIPALKFSQTIYEEVLRSYCQDADAWLDLGCGHQLLPYWRSEEERELVSRARFIAGLDADLPSLKRHATIRNLVGGNISRLPFRAERFDMVTSNMVFEHLRNPENQLRELFRILKPSGILLFHTPNRASYIATLARLVPESLQSRILWFLHRQAEEDTFPRYNRINTEREIRSLAGMAGFEVERLRMIVSSAQFVMIPPLVVPELLLLRLLMMRWARRYRTNIITVLRKPAARINRAVEKESQPEMS